MRHVSEDITECHDTVDDNFVVVVEKGRNPAVAAAAIQEVQNISLAFDGERFHSDHVEMDLIANAGQRQREIPADDLGGLGKMASFTMDLVDLSGHERGANAAACFHKPIKVGMQKATIHELERQRMLAANCGKADGSVERDVLQMHAELQGQRRHSIASQL